MARNPFSSSSSSPAPSRTGSFASHDESTPDESIHDRADSTVSSSHSLDCRSVLSFLGEAVDGRLARQESHAVRTHLLSCPECRREFGKVEQLRKWTRELPSPRLSPDFQSDLFDRIHSGEGASMAILPQSGASRGVAFFASGMATAAALLLSMWLIFGADEARPTPDRDSLTRSGEKTAPRTLGGTHDGRIHGLRQDAELRFVPGTAPVVHTADPATFAREFLVEADRRFERAIQNGQKASRDRSIALLRNNVLPNARESSVLAGVVLQLRGNRIQLPPETNGYLVQVRQHANELAQLLESPSVDLRRFEQTLERASKVERPQRSFHIVVEVPRENARPAEDSSSPYRFPIRSVLPSWVDASTLRVLDDVLRRHGLYLQIEEGSRTFNLYRIGGGR